jgi:hypothetical protein
MKQLSLIRRWFDSERTIGELSELTHGFICYTMEPSLSDTFPLIPPGMYDLKPHNGPRFKDTWAIVGNGITHQPAPGAVRSAILFHAGNLDEASKGCILVGLSIGRLSGEHALLQSRVAMTALRTVLGTDQATLTITEE